MSQKLSKKLLPPSPPRIFSQTKQSNAVRIGSSHSYWSDLYHWLLTLSWLGFLGLICFLYVTVNALFALAYLADGNGIQNARPGSFPDVFFFSVQTLATIGYGAMYPTTTYTNIVAAIEAMVGLLGIAMVTGLAFARFSIPTAKVLFSNVAVISPHNGVLTLMFRTANKRRNRILEAQIQITVVRNEITAEGQFMRRFHDLKLVRSQTPIFTLTWLVMHPIDRDSPLYGMTPEQLAEAEVELVVTLTGIDETVAQTIHARHSFLAQDILWKMRFVDILSRLPDGRRCVDYRRFHDVTPIS